MKRSVQITNAVRRDGGRGGVRCQREWVVRAGFEQWVGRCYAVLLGMSVIAGGMAFGDSRLPAMARKQIGVTVYYDGAYECIPYPGGDVPIERGVCTDVVIRAFRELGYDLQKEVHEDMKAHFPAYPKKWGLKRPDANIDHRRVPNLYTFFTRKGWAVPITDRAADYLPGDIVTCTVSVNLPHVMIVSDKKIVRGNHSSFITSAWVHRRRRDSLPFPLPGISDQNKSEQTIARRKSPSHPQIRLCRLLPPLMLATPHYSFLIFRLQTLRYTFLSK